MFMSNIRLYFIIYKHTKCWKMSKSNVNSFFDQQYGYSHWRDYNSMLNRLKCHKQNTFSNVFAGEYAGLENLYKETPIFACKFAPFKTNEHLLALANEDGKLAVQNTENKDSYGVQAHNNAIFDLAWKFDQLKLVTASGDHTLKMYDVGNGTIQPERTFYGHNRSVKTVAFCRDNPDIFASGGRDGNIILWDTRIESYSSFSHIGHSGQIIPRTHCSKTPLNVNKPSTPGKLLKRRNISTNLSLKSVTGLVFQNNDTLISCGAGDGLIKVWDLRKNYNISKKEANPKYILPYAGTTSRNGFSCLQIDDNGVRLYANCLDNNIYCYNVSTYNEKPVMTYTGHQNSTFYVKSSLSQNGTHLLSGSSDECAYIWDINNAHPSFKLTGHSAEVTCVAWCFDNHKIITCSDDMTHMLWTLDMNTQNNDFKSEIIPLKQPKIPLKRRQHNDTIISGTTPKKIEISCRCCDKSTISPLCENCHRRLKRNSNFRWQDEMCQRFSRELGPKRLFGSLIQEGDVDVDMEDERPTKIRKTSPSNSPTVNLPNYVIDGVAPHISYSPPPKKRKADDWLTRLRIERNLRQEMLERTAGPSTPKTPRLEVNESRSGTPHINSSLHRFFKVRNAKCEVSSCKPHSMMSGTELKR